MTSRPLITLLPTLAIAASLHAQPATQPATQPADTAPIEPETPPTGVTSTATTSLDLIGPNASLDDLEQALDLALTAEGQPADLDQLDPIHRVAAAASRIAAAPIAPAERQRAAELESLAYNALANAALQRDRPTETGLRLMQARTAAEALARQGPDRARQAGDWWRLNADLADAGRLDLGPYPSPRAHRNAIDALERFLDGDADAIPEPRLTATLSPEPQADPRQRAARLTLYELHRDAGNADAAHRLATQLLDDDSLPTDARAELVATQGQLNAPGRRVTLPTTWANHDANDNTVQQPTAWVIEADPALPLTQAVRRALATDAYPALALHTVYVGDPATTPAPVNETHALHRLTASPVERQALSDMAVTRVPAIVLLNGSSRIVATGHAPAVLDRLLIAP